MISREWFAILISNVAASVFTEEANEIPKHFKGFIIKGLPFLKLQFSFHNALSNQRRVLKLIVKSSNWCVFRMVILPLYLVNCETCFKFLKLTKTTYPNEADAAESIVTKNNKIFLRFGQNMFYGMALHLNVKWPNDSFPKAKSKTTQKIHCYLPVIFFKHQLSNKIKFVSGKLGG